MIVMKTMQKLLKFYIALLNWKVYSNHLSCTIHVYKHVSMQKFHVCTKDSTLYENRPWTKFCMATFMNKKPNVAVLNISLLMLKNTLSASTTGYEETGFIQGLQMTTNSRTE